MGIGNLKLNRWGNLIVVAIFLGGWWMVHNFDWENEILLKFATGPYFWPLLIVMFAIFGYLDWQNKGGHGGEGGGGCGSAMASDAVVVISHTNARVRLSHQPYKILNLVRSDSNRRVGLEK